MRGVVPAAVPDSRPRRVTRLADMTNANEAYLASLLKRTGLLSMEQVGQVLSAGAAAEGGAEIPEPATLSLVPIAGALMWLRRRRALRS